jgi:hypothetical protein
MDPLTAATKIAKAEAQAKFWALIFILVVILMLVLYFVIKKIISDIKGDPIEKLKKEAIGGQPSAANKDGTPAYWAAKLYEAIAGAGRDDNKLNEVIAGTTYSFFKNKVSPRYYEATGETAEVAINGEWFSTNYENMIIYHKNPS